MTLTIIGTGAMAKALACGLQSNYTLEIVGRTKAKAEAFIAANALTASAHEVAEFSLTDRTLLLCVKPYALNDVAKQLQGKALSLYSILAGTSVQSLKDAIPSDFYIRAMPNVAAQYRESMTTLTGDTAKQSEAEAIFQSIGKALWLNSEKELDIATGLAGSGPAYLCLIAEALTDGAVKQGLKRQDAMDIARGLFSGFAPMFESSHPALIKDSVMSPGGTTAAGYSALEARGVRAACIDAIERAFKKTQ